MPELGKEGWFEDPADRHEYRWFSDGVPTALVRDGTETSRDAVSINDASAFASMDLGQPPDTAPLLHQPDGAPHLVALNAGVGPVGVIDTNSAAAYRALLAWPSATEQFLIFGVVLAAWIALLCGAVAVFGGLSLLAVVLAAVLSGRRGRRARRDEQPDRARGPLHRALAISGVLITAAAYLAAAGYAVDASLRGPSGLRTPVVGLAGAGSSVKSASNVPAAVTAADLRRRLLTAADLPFGWVAIPVSSDGTLTAMCATGGPSTAESAAVASEFGFERVEDIGESLFSYPGAAQARTAYDADVGYAGGCSTFAYDSRLDSNLDTTMTGHRMTIPAIGDAREALEYVGSGPGKDFSVDLVFILSADTIVEIEESDSGPTDPDTAVTAARTAYAKDHADPAG